ncbi:O-antigen polymerase [Pedobacter jejuensis]|uniref:Oligosaccharide repeat unit polymerase n=1 Tax=Pedobacter jejuensis TaxID=1268550 RepID=A0A3N0C335_9SPHI|nr:O-antigen polymerase [Pedobacter jejuensis]RNL56908.1 hypothetical protein D7004_00385 [Pedobacter jejuensis]
MQDIVFSFDLTTLTFLFFAVFAIYFILLRKQIFLWFDPLLIFIFFNSVSIAFVIYLYFFEHSIKLEYFLSFMSCIIAFIAGIALGGRRGLPNFSEVKRANTIGSSYNYALLVDVFMVICLLIMLISNLLMLLVKGSLPIFSANPSEAKILLYTGGWGIVKRINFALLNFVLAIPLIKMFHPSIKLKFKQKSFYVICLLLCVMIMVTMGSKSSLLIMLNLLFAIALVNKSFGILIVDKLKTNFNKAIISKWAKYSLIIALSFMLTIIVLSGVETSSLDSVITRLVASGDAFYFFYVFDIYSDFNHSAIDYIPHILNPFLAMIRATDYEFAIGAYIINYSIGLPLDALSTFGPNAQHPLEGLIYFGKYGAPFYSFSVGYIISYIRIGFLRRMGPYPNNFILVIYVVLSSMIITAATDVPLFMQVFYDVVIYGVIVLIVSILISEVLNKGRRYV